ncbi:MAG TPA: FtsX-like permease family protein, partial [Vicinamibacteria bacterium]|nr:FtsX-like permease family protein [Vicinamibacteria bacterium]
MIASELALAYPATNRETGVLVTPLEDAVLGDARQALSMLAAAVVLLLIIACANVANMLLARGASRRRELAVRAALGAGRARLLRQLLSESLVLAAMGGAAGGLLALWAGRLLSRLRPDWLPVPLHFDFQPDATVFAYAAAISLGTTVLFGLAPALAASKPDLVPSLKADATGEGSVRRRVALRDVLVVTQLALSLVLLVAGALLGRGLLAARGTGLGFDPAPVAFIDFNLQMNGYDLPRALALRQRLLSDLRALPGVT